MESRGLARALQCLATGCLLGSGRESPGLATLLLRWDCSGSGLEMGSQGLVRALPHLD